MPSCKKRVKHYRAVLDPTMKSYRDHMFKDLSRVVSRYTVLDDKDRVHVITLVKHKIEEGKL